MTRNTHSMNRRRLLAGMAGALAVAGFDPVARRWVAQADAATPSTLAALPPLDGELVVDPALLASVADDFGHLVHRMPVALLLPGSVADIARMVRYARQHGIRIAGRGAGHTAFGQSQAQAGLVIDVGTLDRIVSIGADRAHVEAGVVWRDLLQATLPRGLTPPVLTDYTALTVGGTLSVGGVNGTSHRHGAQVDNVLTLRVVDGHGNVVECSPTRNRLLFDAALAGLGSCAIIVAATVRLVPAKARARTFRIAYPGVQQMLADLRILARAQRTDHVAGNGLPSADGFAYVIEATYFYDHANELPNDPYAGLSGVPMPDSGIDRSYFEFTDVVVQLAAQLRAAGLWGLPHPWLDLFVPDHRIDAFAETSIAQLDPSQFLPGSLLLFYPFLRRRLTRPLLRVPDTPLLFLFDVLRTVPPDPAVTSAVLAQNRVLYEENRRLGGHFYAISAVQMSRSDWQRHFGAALVPLVIAKVLHDPHNVLGAGTTIF